MLAMLLLIMLIQWLGAESGGVQPDLDRNCSFEDSESVLLQLPQADLNQEMPGNGSSKLQPNQPVLNMGPLIKPKMGLVGQVSHLPNLPLEYGGCGFIIGFLALLPLVRLWARSPNTRLTTVNAITQIWFYVWLIGGLVMLTQVIKFNSAHSPEHPERHLLLPEAVYLMVQIVTTVGYGDITPATSNGRAFMAFYIILSILIVADMVMSTIGSVVSKFQAVELAMAEILMENQETVTDSTQGQQRKWYLKKKPAVKWGPFLAALAACNIVLLLGTAFHMVYSHPRLSWTDSFYMCTVTASTVGFGDLTEDGDSNQVIGTAWMLFGVGTFANLVVQFSNLLGKVQDREVCQLQETEELQLAKLKALLERTNKDKLDKNAFLRLGLQHLGMASASDIAKIDLIFQALGPDASGRLGSDEILASGLEVK